MHFPKLTKQSKKQLIIGLCVGLSILILVCATILVLNFRGMTVRAPSTNGAPDVPAVYRHAFTGALLPEPFAGARVACVMVENSADAWPLSGVEDAFLVIEAPVEGNIPRFMACFTEDEDVQKIGPVRSARAYYVSWASGMGALYAHVGGSPEALTLLQATSDVVDLNEFWNGASFWRDGVRFAPHNVYTSHALLWDAADRLALDVAQNPDWVFGDAGISKYASCEHIEAYTDAVSAYRVRWVCDAATGMYTREQGGDPQISSDGDGVVAANVIILETDISVYDDVGRKQIATEGMGNARFCSRGMCQDVVWSKEGVDKPLQFFVSYPDEPVVLAPGKTWIEVIPAGT